MKISTKKSYSIFVACMLVFMAPSVLAHHSGAMYERTEIVTLEGIIKDYEFTNPHVWFRIVVEEDGAPVEWAVTAAAPYRMKEWGLTPKEIKAGDKVVIRAHPLKDGRRGAILIDLTEEDGTVHSTPTER